MYRGVLVSSLLTEMWGPDWRNHRLARGVQVVYPRHKPEKLIWVTLSHLHEDTSVEELFRDILLDPKNPEERYYLVLSSLDPKILSSLDQNNRYNRQSKEDIDHCLYWLQGLYIPIPKITEGSTRYTLRQTKFYR